MSRRQEHPTRALDASRIRNMWQVLMKGGVCRHEMVTNPGFTECASKRFIAANGIERSAQHRNRSKAT